MAPTRLPRPRPRETQGQSRKGRPPRTLTRERNAALPKRVDRFPELRDFYDSYDETTVLPSEKKKYEGLLKDLAKAKLDPALLRTPRNFYLLEFSNVGGLLSPLLLRLDFADGTQEELRLPAEIWRYNTEKTAKLIMTPKELRAVTFDPRQELVDTDLENNFWPRRPVKTKFQLFKEERGANPMQELTRPPEKEKDESAPKPDTP